MNVTFHALGSFATAALLSLRSTDDRRSASALKKYLIGFVIGILVHGALDFLPHNYPLPSKFDVVLTLFLLGLSIFLAKKQNRLLLSICFAGAIFPDVVDLSAGIANRHLGIPVPQFSFRIFPWHRKEFSGSIYDGGRKLESIIYHFSVLLVSCGLIYLFRQNLFKIRENKK